MQKWIAPIILILGLFLLFFTKDIGPYSGRYRQEQDTGNVLILKDNNSFTLYFEHGKVANQITGKYTVEDNKIQLSGSEPEVFFPSYMKVGKVQGSMITFFNETKSKNIVFRK